MATFDARVMAKGLGSWSRKERFCGRARKNFLREADGICMNTVRAGRHR